MVAGLLLGYLGTKLFPTDDWIALTIGFSIGLITGHIIGSKKDKVIRKNKKLM
jgi:F0F1-type ATP synthase assembly protein I